VPQSQAATAPQTSGQPAPIPTAAPAAKPPPVPLPEAEALAAANDIRGCRDAAQKIRRAGVAMPPPLLALAGLRLEVLETAQR
jgi:hypothetical protein